MAEIRTDAFAISRMAELESGPALGDKFRITRSWAAFRGKASR